MYIVPLNWARSCGVQDIGPYNMVDYHCAIISVVDAEHIMEVLNGVASDHDSRVELGIDDGIVIAPALGLNSNLGGIKFILSYFADDTYIENCMHEDIRMHPGYIALSDIPKPRVVNSHMLPSEMLRKSAEGDVYADTGEDVETAVEGAVPEPEAIDNATALVLDMNRLSQDYEKVCEDGAVVITPKKKEYQTLLPSLLMLSKRIQKKVCAIFNASQLASIPGSSIKDEDIVYIVFNTHIMKTKPVFAVSTDAEDNDRVACLGNYCAHTLLPEKRNGEHFNPYFGLDRVWSDEATGVMYACKKANFIYTTVVFNSVCDYSIVCDRIAEKWNRGVSTAAADVELMKGLVSVDKAAYVRQSADGANTYIAQMKEKLEEVMDAVTEMQQKLADAMKMRRQLQEVVDAFNPDAYDKKMREQAETQFNAVAAMDKVRSIYIGDDGVVTVLTKEIHCKDPRTEKVHNIGKLMIKLNMLTPKYNDKNNILIKNLSHRVQGFSGRMMMAPHIYEDGHICHGNLSQLVIQHYAERDIYAIMEDLFAFVESVNTEDGAGKCINEWPEVVTDPVSPEDETDDELIRNLKGGI